MRRKKDEELFEDLGFEEEDYLQPEEFDQLMTGLSEQEEEYDEDPAELERRRQDYAKLRKTDKIFNNSYNTGIPVTEEEHRSSSSQIKLDSGSAEYHLYDKEKYSDHLDNKIIQFDIDKFISGSKPIMKILGNEPEKKKFTKPEINSLFELIIAGVSTGDSSSVFVSSIHVLDAISSITNTEYKKLFDMLTYENKETLLLELNKKYKFLDKPSKNLKMF